MNKLKSMQIFIAAVELGSFTKTAQQHGITPTMVGKHIKALEKELGTRLLLRTTRKQSLTETGNIYFTKCKKILGELSLLENQLQVIESKPKGLVRINAPITLSNQVLSPILADFLVQYPDIDLEVIGDNQRIDPIKSQYDLLIRIGELEDSELIAREIGHYQMLYCASPTYIQQYGSPVTLQELSHHTCLGFLYQQQALSAEHNMQDHHCRLLSNSGQMLVNLALAGAGIVLQPKILVNELLKQGALVQVLHQQSPKPEPIHLLYPHKQIPLKVKTLVNFILNRGAFDKIN